ncbi:MAG TPA: DNA polymerase III subunit delta' [Caulobacteraceae bacterium]|nr:DNA polymerase III subunit delta' [Caulobacteraceae bacterium]
MSEPADIPHPRDVYRLPGAERAEAAFLDALARGRLHHAWLLVGPEGLGKATFAYRAARRLLGAAPDPAFGVLGASPEDPVSRQVAARAHPDLKILERQSDEGRVRKSIPVEEARRLPEFFAKSPGRAAHRVAIIDSADDLNVSAANAVLKTLEEPPQRGVLLLISHRPDALLPTIRSRCRRLVFDIPPQDTAAAWLADAAGVSPEAAGALLRIARGAPGRALRLARADALALDEAARGLLESLPDIDPSAALALADGFRGAEGPARFALLMDRLAASVRETAVDAALQGRGAPAAHAEAFQWLASLPDEVESLNLDRADAFFTALQSLRALPRPC